MNSAERQQDMTPVGLPHSEISGSTPACDSPKLFAANHVLHRLLTPRHSPCALSSLITNLIGTLRGFRTSGSLRVGKAALRSLQAPTRTNPSWLKLLHRYFLCRDTPSTRSSVSLCKHSLSFDA